MMNIKWQITLLTLMTTLATVATGFYFLSGYILAYGDAESHLNIAKRVTDSLTPGLAQLGGIWLPLPHLLLVPFTSVNWLWRTGLAGSIVSGICYVAGGYFLFKLIQLVTKNEMAAFWGVVVYAVNPNILYLQSTAMTEIPLLTFFIASVYFIIRYILNPEEIISLISGAGFGMLATLTRYDAWFIVTLEAVIVAWVSIRKKDWKTAEGRFLLFSVLGFLGIGLWLLWDLLILHDPLYFTNSPFSAKSQQQGWLARGQLPAYKNWTLSTLYYSLTTVGNLGNIVSVLVAGGLIIYLFDNKQKERWFAALLMATPFVFYVVTLYLGQSIIFIPQLTPPTFEWRLFNVRYGLVMMPLAAFLVGYLYSKANLMRGVVAGALIFQVLLFFGGSTPAITLEDGVTGLSSSLNTNRDSQLWLTKNYDGGLVLVDDFARTTSIIKSNIPMKSVIYVGNKPYWEESLANPEKYATWVIAQEHDAVWNTFITNPAKEAQLYKYYVKAYTSPDILIFKRNRTE